MTRKRAMLVMAAAFLALGLALPVLRPEASLWEAVDSGALGIKSSADETAERGDFSLSITQWAAGKQVQWSVLGTYWAVDANTTWLPRLVLAAALFALAALILGWRAAAGAACTVLLGCAIWAFITLHPMTSGEPYPSWTKAAQIPESWTAYPPLSAVEARGPVQAFETVWWAWAALGVGTALAACAVISDVRSHVRRLAAQ